MKVRVIVGISCAIFAIGLLVLFGFGYGAYVGIIATFFTGLATHEVMNVSGCKNKVLNAIATATAVVTTLYISFDLGRYVGKYLYVGLGIYALAILILMLKMFETTRFENVAIAVVTSFGIPMAACSLFETVRFMDSRPDLFCRSNAIFCLLMAMFAAWLNDAAALFTGRAFGKHKMSPKISPHKSVEGAIGGILVTTVFSFAAWLICNHFYFSTDTIKWWMVLVCVPVLCVMGILGDLTASAIKRNYGVKDFGTLFPEHGGAMDRIDSFLFSMPATYLLIRLCVMIFG